MEIIADLEPDALWRIRRHDRLLRLRRRDGYLSRHPHHDGRGNTVSVQAGAGIVADSNPSTEFQETVNKASAMLARLTQTKI